jgi:hypothetical protein
MGSLYLLHKKVAQHATFLCKSMKSSALPEAKAASIRSNHVTPVFDITHYFHRLVQTSDKRLSAVHLIQGVA